MNMKKAAGLMFVAFGGAGLLAACGLEEGVCTFDSDCPGAQVCYQTACTNLCTTDADCAFEDEECVARPGSADGMVCQQREETLPPDTCDPADQDSCPTGFFCLVDTCIEEDGPVAPTYYTVEIRDTTTDPLSCADVTYGWKTPGAKPMYAYLLSATDDILAYGTAVGANLTGDSDYDSAFEIFDGNAPDYEGECPETVANYPRGDNGTVSNTNMTADTVVALGCGGSLFLAFYDGANRIPLATGQQIVVGEYGPFCKADNMSDAQTRNDLYAVNVCTSPTESIFENDTCTISLATGRTGIAIVDVTIPAAQ
jgi:hypothetical protein